MSNTIDDGDAKDGSEGGYDSHGNYIIIEAMEEIVSLRARVKELEAEKLASEVPCSWIWNESRQEYTTSCLFGVTYADCDYCPKCGKKVDKRHVSTEPEETTWGTGMDLPHEFS